MKKIKNQKQNGITLIALIITVIVLLILAGTAITIAINGGDIFGKASDARTQWNIAVETENTTLNEVLGILNTVTSENNGGGTTVAELTMTLDGVEVTGITQANFAQHLGKVVTNYSGAPTSITNSEGTFTVSNTYRLYWIDWNNKYGDGAGTIYLKADCTSNNSALSQETTTETVDPAISVLRKLNPEMYKAGKTAPAVNSDNMKALRWLTDTTKWSGATTGVSSSIANKVNYVAGAPSVEMMMDSYNAHYGLTGDTPDISAITAGTRTKIFYQYPYDEDNFGYGVGPSSDNGEQYYTYTSDNSVYTDNNIDTMYYPGSGNYYWLASPSANYSDSLLYVGNDYGGYIGNVSHDGNGGSLCPLVSLQPDVVL